MKKTKRNFFYEKGLYLTMFAALLLISFSCNKNDDPVYPVYPVTVQLTYPEGFEPVEGIEILLGTYKSTTNANGIATFEVTEGTYVASASEQREDEYYKYNFNANKGGISITQTWTGTEPIKLEYELLASLQPKEGDPSPIGRIIVKELYNGGCPSDDGKTFIHGTYLILYNNSTGTANLKNLTIATALPSNGHTTNNFLSNGVLSYASENWLPAGFGVFYFPNDVELAPGKQIVIALTSAIDNTKTYSQAVNFANSEYYAVYDPESGYNHANYYPAPAQEIPTSHHLKAIRLANVTSNAYIVSVNSPALFIFTPPAGTSVASVATDPNRLTTHGNSASQAVLKVPVDWVIDGIEVFFNPNLSTSNKRLTPNVDGGWVGLTNNLGYTLYRNVDKAATEAIAGNAGKLVYNYSMGTSEIKDVNGTTDPTGIDAEASIKNGAHIIYKRTNNSTNDFHQRKKASLRN